MTSNNVVERFMLALLLLFSNIGRIAAQSQKIPLLFDGLLVNDSGRPVPGAQLQFWQADAKDGLYNHPQSAFGSMLDPTFQYFGTETTDDDGRFVFKTYKPAPYTTRPPHIHFKVWVDGENVLTSQFYFAEDGTEWPSSLLLELEGGANDEGDKAFLARKTIAIDLGGGGTTPLTPRQTEGPFYPVVNFFDLDGDLTMIDDAQGGSAPAPTDAGEGGMQDDPMPGPPDNTTGGDGGQAGDLAASGQTNGAAGASRAGGGLSGIPLAVISLCFSVLFQVGM